MVLLELLGVWLGAGTYRSTCTHSHSILIFASPFPLVSVFIDTFTVLPTGTEWLGNPNLNIGANGFSLGFWVTGI
jgi:hypothetical protein